MRELQVTLTHTPTVTTAVERYVTDQPYIRNGGRKKKDGVLPITKDCEQTEDVKRCSIANSKRTFKATNDFDIQDYDACRNKFNLFWKSLKRCPKLTEVDLRYVGAIEFQQNGNIHFHILCRIPKQFKPLLKAKWKYGGLHYEYSKHTAEDAPKIASYLNKGIHDDRLPLGHSDVKTTMNVYTHVTASAKEDAIFRYTEYLGS